MAATLVLAASTAMVAWGGLRVDRSSNGPELATDLPMQIATGTVEDLPLGRNERADFGARAKLDFDDMVYRAYTTPEGAFTVYIGYWAGGKRAPSFVAAHTPDRCWTLNGMLCDEFRNDVSLAVGDARLPPGQWRRFSDRNGNVSHVIFWHVVGDGLYDYGSRFHSYTQPWIRVVDVVKDTFFRADDQYFVRIVSSKPIEEWIENETFISVVENLPGLKNLRRPKPAEMSSSWKIGGAEGA